MNKLLLLLFLSFFYTHVHAQKIDSAAMAHLSAEQRTTVEALLQEQKHAYTGAFVTLGVGIAAGITGLIVYANAIDNDVWGDGEDPSVGGLVIAGLGTAIALFSIPQFSKAHAAGRSAKAIVFGSKGVSMAPGIIMPHTQSAGLKLVIPLGR